MLSILAPILVFGLVIFVHELGHFLAAKAVGVYAPRFSIGFGPALFRRRKGETEYIVAAIPLGGYVRMASRLDTQVAFLEGGPEESEVEGAQTAAPVVALDPNEMVPFGSKPVPEDRWFESKPLAARLLIMFAGVTMNIVLAFVILTSIALIEGRPVTPTRVVGAVAPAFAGAPLPVHVGDTIVTVNGDSVHVWQDVEDIAERTPSARAVTFGTNRGPIAVPVASPAQLDTLIGSLAPRLPAVIGSVVPGDPADKAGLQANDSIVAIAGHQITAWADLQAYISGSTGVPLDVRVLRSGKEHTVSITPIVLPGLDSANGTPPSGKIGVMVRDGTIRLPVTIFVAIREGARGVTAIATEGIKLIRRLFAFQSASTLSGPIGIAVGSVKAAQAGAIDLFLLIAEISVSVAVINLLPIPILDGGQVVINVIETVRRKPLALRTREYMLWAGLIVIGALFLTGIYNDTRGWGAGLAHWFSARFGRT